MEFVFNPLSMNDTTTISLNFESKKITFYSSESIKECRFSDIKSVDTQGNTIVVHANHYKIPTEIRYRKSDGKPMEHFDGVRDILNRRCISSKEAIEAFNFICINLNFIISEKTK